MDESMSDVFSECFGCDEYFDEGDHVYDTDSEQFSKCVDTCVFYGCKTDWVEPFLHKVRDFCVGYSDSLSADNDFPHVNDYNGKVIKCEIPCSGSYDGMEVSAWVSFMWEKDSESDVWYPIIFVSWCVC